MVLTEAFISTIEFIDEWEDMYQFYSDCHKSHWGFRPRWEYRPSIESMRAELFGFNNVR